MKGLRFSSTLLAAALALAVGSVSAQTPDKRNASAEKELAAAQAELNRAAKRVAELSQKTAEAQVRRLEIEQVRARKPRVGVLMVPDARAGVQIAGVTPDSAAAKAGLRSGDRLISVNGNQILGNTGELRMANARKLLDQLDDKTAAKLGYQRAGRNAVVSLTPQVSNGYIVMFDGLDGDIDNVRPVDIDIDKIRKIAKIDGRDFHFDKVTIDPPPGISPEIQKEIRRISSAAPYACKGDNCKAPALLSAFRWNGLNLASVDAQLGRYFGTDRGVLVLSNGELSGLQAGDVIQKIDGKTVNSPREAMEVLRGKPADAMVAMTYLRDRKTGRSQIKVPKLMAFPPLPPAPPAPPAAPRAPRAPAAPAPPPPLPASAAIPLPPTPPAPPAPPSWAVSGEITHIHVLEGGRGTSR